MKMKGHTKLVALTAVAALSAYGVAQTVSAQSTSTSRTFECKTVSGVPTTVVKDSRGERQMIRWTTHTGGAGYTPQRRCQEVSNRMNTYFSKSGQYITHGVMNRQKVLCITDQLGKDCLERERGLLYTLKPDQDPKTTLEDLFELNDVNVARGPRREPPCPTYVSVDAVIAGKTRFAQEDCSR